MKKQENKGEFERFDSAMGHLMTVPYSKLKEQLEEEKGGKKEKKKGASPSSSVRVSSGRKPSR
jgi:hypothetical protein